MTEFNSFFVNRSFERLLQLKGRVEKDFDDVEAFASVLKYLQYNIPYGVVKTLLSDDIYEREVKEFDLVDERMSKTLSGYEEFFAPYIDNIDSEVMKKGLSMFLYGANSSGKTFTALHILASAIERGLTGYYITFKELLNIYNSANFKNESEDRKIYEHILSCDFFVCDEIAKESSVTANVIGVLEEVIKRRAEASLPTIFISNINFPDSESGLLARYGNSVYSALITNYKVIYFSPRGEFRKRTQVSWELD